MKYLFFSSIPLMILLTSVSAFADLVVYPPLSRSQLSTTYSMTVNDQPVPVQQYNGKSYAWFAFSGSANVRVTASEPILNYRLSPRSYDISSTTDGMHLSFTLNEPRKLVLRKVNSLAEELFIFADPLESNAPRLNSPGVVNVLDYGADSNGNKDSQDAFQNAIDAVTAQPKGGVVYIPQGLYKISKTVFLKSNVHLYLAPGAILEVPIGVGCCFGYATVLLALDSSNIRISGRGVVHGNGTKQSLFFWLVTTENADHFQVEDIMLLDGFTTALRLQDARNSDVTNLKILSGSPRLSDGIDIESSQNITVDRCFIYSSDDNIAIGAGTDPRKTVRSDEHILIKKSVFYQTKTGHTFYIGPHVAPPHIRNITFDNNDVVSAESFTGIYPFGGVSIETVAFSNVRVEEVRDAEPISLYIADCSSWGEGNCGNPRGVYGYIHNIRFDNFSFENHGTKNSIFQGYSPTADVNGVYFRNFSLAGTLISSTSMAHFDIHDYVSNLVFTNDTPVPSPGSASDRGRTDGNR